MALLVIVTGPPGSGKSTLSALLSSALQLPVLSKDPIKERLAGSLGVDGLDWSRRLGAATYELLLDLVVSLLDGGASLIVDGNLHPDFARDRLRPIAAIHQIVQIVCSADPPVLSQRVRERAGPGTRHPIHCDEERLGTEELAASFERDHAIDLPGVVVRVDTTDGGLADVERLINALAGVAGEG